jgi:hypothetical protein
MPSGVGAVTLQTIPSEPFVTDPNLFFQMTEKNVVTAKTLTAPTPGGFTTTNLLQTGIVSKLVISFVGQMVVSTASVTTSNEWPYKALGAFNLSANGQNDLFNCNGIDLHTLRYIKYPAYKDATDQFPGTVGGGDTVTVGTYALNLTWEVPIAMDDTSLVGSLYAQSSSTNLQIRLALAQLSDLFSANPANVAITGQFNIQETYFEIPYNAQGQIVVPDLSRLHGFNATEGGFTNTGETRLPLIRSAGQLSRLLFSGYYGVNNRLSAAPNAATTKKLDALRLEYGGNKRPFVYDPLALQLALNNQHYGSTPPYDRVVLDFVKENPIRDIIMMQGVTELALVPRVNSGVTVAAPAAFRTVQETLF